MRGSQRFGRGRPGTIGVWVTAGCVRSMNHRSRRPSTNEARSSSSCSISPTRCPRCRVVTLMRRRSANSVNHAEPSAAQFSAEYVPESGTHSARNCIQLGVAVPHRPSFVPQCDSFAHAVSAGKPTTVTSRCVRNLGDLRPGFRDCDHRVVETEAVVVVIDPARR